MIAEIEYRGLTPAGELQHPVIWARTGAGAKPGVISCRQSVTGVLAPITAAEHFRVSIGELRHVTILNNAETIRYLWKVDILEMGVSPGFCLSKACCLYADRLDDNRIALVGR